MWHEQLIVGSQRKRVDRLFIMTLMLLAATFPFNLRVSSLMTVALGCSWLFLGYYRNAPLLLRNKFFLLFVLFFVVPFLSLFYSEQKDLAALEKRMFLLVYPLIFFTIPRNERTLKAVLHAFSAGCTVAAWYALVITLSRGEVLSTEMTKQHLGITHVYFGWYLAFSIMSLTHYVLTKYKYDYRSWMVIIQILFQLFFLFALGAKMAIIALFVVGAAAAIRFIIRTRRWILGAAIFVIPLSAFLITMRHFDIVNSRFHDLFEPENYFVGDNAWNSIGVRLSILKCLSETIITAPVFGTGIGDVQPDLDQCYTSNGLASIVGMNAHNQFLQFLVGTGVVSVIAFFAVFIMAMREASRSDNRLYLLFICLFLLCCLTESLLERQHGTMFFGFFNSLLFVGGNNNDVQKPVDDCMGKRYS